MKVDDLFFRLQLKLGWHFRQAETETPFQKSWIRHWKVYLVCEAKNARNGFNSSKL